MGLLGGVVRAASLARVEAGPLGKLGKLEKLEEPEEPEELEKLESWERRASCGRSRMQRE